MNSIKLKLSRYLTLSISTLLVIILLLTDIGVDNWISNEFDRAMTSKSGFLVTLVEEDLDQVEFHFADEFMPEFSGNNDPEYFQLWRDNQVFERSKTLELFEENHLPKLDVELNKAKITNITLPDGRSGRLYFTKFKPQIDSDDRQVLGGLKQDFIHNQKIMELAYAISIEELEQILWFVDIIFILSSLTVVFAVRLIVFKVVKKGLSPLEKLNTELKSVNLNSNNSSISTHNLPIELTPIANGINHFLNENKILYSREKRITSDIAHELKTPIAELLNLTEVSIKFPHEQQLNNDYKAEVLSISQRLKNIVNGILLLQKSTNGAQLAKKQVNISQLLNQIILRENINNRVIKLDVNPHITALTNDIALETILSNLISNAIYYSPDNSDIFIASALTDDGKITLMISNISVYQYDEVELQHFFEPLWQKDSSRTSSDRYGLGLAIVKSYCDNIGVDVSVAMKLGNTLTFTLTI